MTSTNTQIISYSPPPSSSSKSTRQFAYEVFLSFRGEDTRYGFTDHLYEALISYGIHTFRDDEEIKRGGEVASELLNAIEESKIFVIIFSENYATSRWCLDELVKIFECMATKQRLILPIFYHVDPSDVRKQSGSYEQAFLDHEREADVEKKEKIQKWRLALTKAGNLAGYDLQKYRLIKEIIDREHGWNEFSFGKLKSLIKIESNDVRMIGIYGFGGIGKTTISKVVYNNIFHLFESSIFLSNVRERSQDYLSRLQLQKELLNNFAQKGSSILDDVDKLEQLEYLIGERGWFGLRSRIIITTRDQHLLKEHEVDVPPYEVKELDYENSLQLFYITKLKRKPNMKVQNVLRTSFDGLDEIEKDIFLDVACFFKGCNEKDVTRRLDHAKGVIRVLSDKCLITLSHNIIRMHDLVQEMGREIVRHDHPKEPGKWSRLWDLEDICLILRKKTCLQKLKVLNLSSSQQLTNMPRFSNMSNLEKLNIQFCGSLDNVDSSIETFPEITKDMKCLKALDLSGTCIKELPSSIEYLNHLTSLRMVECKSLRSLPSNIYRLKSLNLFSKTLFKLGDVSEIMEDMGCLKELDLSCSNLEAFPEIMEYMECLEKLDLSGTCIKELPSSIEYLNHLTSLSLVGVKILKSLSLKGCSNLEAFPEIMEDMKCLKYLDLSGASIKKLPSSIGYLNHLTSLRLSHCKNLRSLPSSIGRLTLLTELYLNGCPNLVTEDMENLINLGFSETQNLMDGVTPSDLWCISSLVKLDLSQNDMRHIPAAITQLCNLEHLNISHCNMLEEIPELPPIPLRSMVVRMKCGCLYCPKTAIRDKFQSDQYMHLEASFDILLLVAGQNHQQNHISLLDFPENSGDSRSTIKDIKRSHDDAAHNQAEEPYHKRLRESNTHLNL
ncbi:hypothetical protein AAG906_019422 [Vitis piasezkii]